MLLIELVTQLYWIVFWKHYRIVKTRTKTGEIMTTAACPWNKDIYACGLCSKQKQGWRKLWKVNTSSCFPLKKCCSGLLASRLIKTNTKKDLCLCTVYSMTCLRPQRLPWLLVPRTTASHTLISEHTEELTGPKPRSHLHLELQISVLWYLCHFSLVWQTLICHTNLICWIPFYKYQ